jgi:hypothetical protein
MGVDEDDDGGEGGRGAWMWAAGRARALRRDGFGDGRADRLWRGRGHAPHATCIWEERGDGEGAELLMIIDHDHDPFHCILSQVAETTVTLRSCTISFFLFTHVVSTVY